MASTPRNTGFLTSGFLSDLSTSLPLDGSICLIPSNTPSLSTSTITSCKVVAGNEFTKQTGNSEGTTLSVTPLNDPDNYQLFLGRQHGLVEHVDPRYPGKGGFSKLVRRGRNDHGEIVYLEHFNEVKQVELLTVKEREGDKGKLEDGELELGLG